MGCSPWGREESDRTERLHFQFSRSCIGEGNGNPLQCSCLETPRDGVAQSQTRLKRLSSSSIRAEMKGTQGECERLVEDFRVTWSLQWELSEDFQKGRGLRSS